jgi:hypothetical protein
VLKSELIFAADEIKLIVQSRGFDSHTDVCSLLTRIGTRVPELVTRLFRERHIIGLSSN